MVVKGKKKNPPIMSHEFFIQNHADIVAVIAMVFMLGLMVEFLHPLASSFIALSHNVTDPTMIDEDSQILFRAGPKDVPCVFFYTLIMILCHAIIQEFVLDKFNKKLNLSKVKFAKFNDSGQLVAFYAFSFIFAGNILWNMLSAEEGYLKFISGFWVGYPENHIGMSWSIKLFYILQIAYWIHTFPELYLTKTKKEDMLAKITVATLYLITITAGYCMHYQKVMLALLALQYLVEGILHLAKVLYFLDKQQIAQGGFRLWAILFVLVRVGTVILSVLTFWFGFGRVHEENPSSGTSMFGRSSALLAICLLQAWMTWNFITFYTKRSKDSAPPLAQPSKKSSKASNGTKKKQQ